LLPDPDLIPGYRILERVASGGVSSVFRALSDSQGIEVALKVMSLADLDPEYQPFERFEREAALLGRLSHPALPRFYSYGITPEGLGWIALELVAGSPLSQYKERSVIELIPLFIQVAEGLQAVAQEGIVHRDVSPDNILVEERHGRLYARLIDFGVAKDLLAAAGGLTQHGAFIGKLAYASPEQLVGAPRGETIDFRSDVYSMGMSMYELLAGHRAILVDGLTQVVDAHIKGTFPPLDIPPERGGPAPRLVSLVTRMTARRREDRPASWEQIVAELWRCREEAAPLTETLAKKRVTRAGETGVVMMPATIGKRLSREMLVGRIVLVAGAASFLGAVLFAVLYMRSRGTAPAPSAANPVPVAVSAPPTPEPTRAPVQPAPATKPPASPAAAHSPTAHARDRRTPAVHRTPTAPRPTRPPRPAALPAATGVLEVTMLPGGELDEIVGESGESVAKGRPLPARFELPPGRYRLRLTSRGIVDCTKTVTATVRSARTTTLSETCVEVK
jgi:serine/threonine-protein kinase